jgi:hypothetical protein
VGIYNAETAKKWLRPQSAVAAGLVAAICAQLVLFVHQDPLLVQSPSVYAGLLPAPLSPAGADSVGRVQQANLFGPSAPPVKTAAGLEWTLLATLSTDNPASGAAIFRAADGTGRVASAGETLDPETKLVEIYVDRAVVDRGGQSMVVQLKKGAASPETYATLPSSNAPLVEVTQSVAQVPAAPTVQAERRRQAAESNLEMVRLINARAMR